MRCLYFAIFKYNFEDKAWHPVEISPLCPAFQLEDRPGKAWSLVISLWRVTAPPCPPSLDRYGNKAPILLKIRGKRIKYFSLLVGKKIKLMSFVSVRRDDEEFNL